VKHLEGKICMQTISNTKYLLDTNIFVYAVDPDASMHRVAKECIDAVLDGTIHAVLSHQNIVEFINVMVGKQRQSKELTLKIIYTFATKSNFSIIHPQDTTYATFLNLCQDMHNRRKQFFDLYLAATMLDNDITHIITANDEDFANIPGITAINPWKQKVV
jgi:predicted nucleic acid-binding protein